MAKSVSNKERATVSLPLAMLYYVNRFYTFAFLICQMGIQTFKCLKYYTTEALMAWGYVSIILYFLIEMFRLPMALQATKTKRLEAHVNVQICTGGLIVLHALWLSQVYVLRIDLILNSIGLIIVGTEFLLGIVQSLFLHQQ